MLNFKRKLYGYFGLPLCLFVVACTSQPTLNQEELKLGKSDAAISQESYRIGVDDTVQVSVWRNPELAVTVPVRPDGKISMPLIGDVQAGGLSPEQVATEIKRKLSNYIRDPQVAVILTALHCHALTVCE